MTDLWQPNNARTRRVRPITEAELAKIMNRTKLPHPNDYMAGAPTALNIISWVCGGIAVVTILAALLA